MTIGDTSAGHKSHLPEAVTQVRKDTIKAFPHSKRVGGYLLGQTLGVGSFAKVKEGLHLTTGEKVAIKIIDKKRAKTDNYVRKNLRREGKLLQLIRHPNVVSLLEVMETDNSYYLVTEICRGGDLMNYISARKRLPEAEVSKFIRQIVSAVDYLHRMGVIHRDLKIENLLLDENKNIKLIDFGLSNFIKVADHAEGTKAQEFCVTQCGSPAYAAPELLNHEKYGLQVDLWSIGVNMYAMLTGGLPFTVEPFNIKALYTKMRDGQMNPLPDGLTKECTDLLMKFLNPDPALRVTIPQALSHSWLTQGNKPISRQPCPNRIRAADLDADILSHMSDNLNFRMAEVIKSVTYNTPSPACATYHLFCTRLRRYQAETKPRETLTRPINSRRRSESNSITLHLQDVSTDATSHEELTNSSAHDGVVSRQSTQPSQQAVGPDSNNTSSKDNKGSLEELNTERFKNNKNALTNQDSTKPCSNNRATREPPASPDISIPNKGKLNGAPKQSALQAMKELLSKGKTAFEVTTARNSDHAENEKLFIEKWTPCNKIHPVRSEMENLKDKFTYACTESHFKRTMSPAKIHLSASIQANPEITSRANDNNNTSNHRKALDENSTDIKSKAVVGHGLQCEQHEVSTSENCQKESPSHSRRYVQNNRLLSRRNAIKTIDMNSNISDEKIHFCSQPTAGCHTLRTGSLPSPVLTKRAPKQLKSFHGAQERSRSSENCPPHFVKQQHHPQQKTKTSDYMILHGKNLLNLAYSEDFTAAAKLAVSPPPTRPAVVRRKLAKRHRLNDQPQAEVCPLSDAESIFTTNLLMPDVSDMVVVNSSREERDRITSSLPSIAGQSSR